MCVASSGVDCLQVLLKVTDVEMENCLVGNQWLQILISDVFFFLFLDASQYTCCLRSVLTARLSICDISGGTEKHVFAFGPPIHTCQLCVHNMSRQIKN